MTTLNEVLDAVMELPTEQQEILLKIVQQRMIDNRQEDIDRTGINRDLEVNYATGQAMAFLNGYLLAMQTVEQQGFVSPAQQLDADRYEQNKLILKKWCVSGDQQVCSILSSIQDTEDGLKQIYQMNKLIG